MQIVNTISQNQPIPLEEIKIDNGEGLTKFSKFEIHKLLEPILKEIDKDLAIKLSLKKIVPLVLKNYRDEFKRKPFLGTLYLLGALGFCGYAAKNFVEGVFAGEILLKNTAFLDLFSSDVVVQENAGGAITNAVQDVQFIKDGFLITIGLACWLFRSSYQKTKHKIIEECYYSFLNQSLSVEQKDLLYELMQCEQLK